MALSLEEDHRQAIKIREEQTLPIYRERLGDHPFTATILNNLSNNFHALGESESAKQYSQKALKIRRELLKDHKDTAKSLFDLGMVLKERKEFKEAKANLEQCMDMQVKVLEDNITYLERYVAFLHSHIVGSGSIFIVLVWQKSKGVLSCMLSYNTKITRL